MVTRVCLLINLLFSNVARRDVQRARLAESQISFQVSTLSAHSSTGRFLGRNVVLRTTLSLAIVFCSFHSERSMFPACVGRQAEQRIGSKRPDRPRFRQDANIVEKDFSMRSKLFNRQIYVYDARTRWLFKRRDASSIGSTMGESVTMGPEYSPSASSSSSSAQESCVTFTVSFWE
jgi:hypothetical protein